MKLRVLVLVSLFASSSAWAVAPPRGPEPGATKQLKRAIKHYKHGSELYSKGKLDSAVAQYREALRLEPEEAYWHLALAMALEKTHDRQAALEEYRVASQLAPHDSGLPRTYDDLLSGLQKAETGTGPKGKEARTVSRAYADGGDVYSVDGNVTAPIPIYQPDPPYSEEARKAKYSGTLVLRIIMDARGNVRDIQVVKPLGVGFDENAVSTVETWKFKPALRNGVPVAVRMLVEVTFRLF